MDVTGSSSSILFESPDTLRVPGKGVFSFPV